MSKFDVVGILDDWKKGDLAGNQMVNIVLSEYGTIHGGKIALTAQLAHDDEIDCAVDQLIADLEIVRKNAKKNLKATNERIRNSR